jgi:LmbE family N-acetylglucosaminyl deacetylase
LGADNCWIDLPEALYRTYEGFSELFGAIKSYDQRLTEDLAQTMNQISDQAPSARIYVPLGIGGHVDHQIVCQAILRSNVRQNNILFYEDFPYVVKSGVTPDAKRRVMAQHLEDVSDTLDTKVEAIFCYRSQINFLLSYLLQEHVEQTMQRCRLEEVLKEYSHSLAQCAMSEAHAAGVKSPSWFAERYWTL